MALQGLGDLFGAALAPLATDGVLHKTTTVDDGAGGFSTTTLDLPIRLVMVSASDKARVASGLPTDAVAMTVFQAGLPVTIRVDDSITTAGTTYRVVAATAEPAGVSIDVTGVPA